VFSFPREIFSMSLPALILASSSPRRQQLLADAGYPFVVVPPHDSAECGICSRETPPEMVARLAYQKGADVALRTESGMVVACDTVAECCGHILASQKTSNMPGKCCNFFPVANIAFTAVSASGLDPARSTMCKSK
jgi:hypothetical protein